MGIPVHTRIIVIPDSNNSTKEYGITRGMIVSLLLLVVLVSVTMGLLLYAFAGKHDEQIQIKKLKAELADAHNAVRLVSQLREELDYMTTAQEKLLYMLGVSDVTPAADDSLVAWLESAPGSSDVAMRRAAAITQGHKPSLWPAQGYVTKEYIVGKPARGINPHLGLDIAGEADSPVFAAAGGTVVRLGTDSFLGNYVEIQHGLGYLTVYGHCSRIAVGKGDKVDGGQVIAYMGKTGQSSANHLHFEIWRQGEPINPREMLSGDPAQN